MARKTNKTAHVLNLIAGGEEREDSSLQEEPVESPPASKVAIIDPDNPSDPLSSLIRESLDKEIPTEAETDELSPVSEAQDNSEAEAQNESKASSKSDEQPAKAESQTVASASAEILTQAGAEALNELQAQAGTDASAELQLQAGAEAQDELQPQAGADAQDELQPQTGADGRPETQAASEADADAPAISSPVSEARSQPEEDLRPAVDYSYVNVMDLVVEDRLLEFMERFELCTCDRCKLDVKALTLSNMPPKYIVTANSTIAPLMSFYKSKYSVYLVSELTKACFAVLDNPRHDA